MNLNDDHQKLRVVYRYGFSILLFAFALAVRLLILPVESGFAFITFYPLIVIVFYLCNIGPGIWVVLLSSFFSYYILTPPFWVLSLKPVGFISILIFVFSAALIAFIVKRMQYYQQALSISEQSHIAILNDQTETICRFKADGEILYVNDAFCRFFSKSAEAVIGTSWQPIVIEEDLEQVHAKLNTLSPLNPVVTIENRVVTANGEIRWGQFINRAFFDQYSNLLQIQSVGRDITEQKQTELVNRELYNRLTLIASRVPGVIYQYKLYPDGTSCFPYASEAIRSIYRITPEQVMSDASVVFKVIHTDDYEGVVSSIQQSARSLEPWQYEYRVKFADETVRWLSGNAIPALEADGSVLWHGYVTDITAQKQIESALKRESEKNTALLRYASDGITIMDFSGTLVEVSDTFCNMLGYAREEMIGMHVSQWDVGILESELMEKIKAQFAQPIRVQFETRHRRKDGTIYDAEISGYPIHINGQPLLFNSTRDITERKLLEAKLLASANEIQDLYNHAPCGYHSLDSEGIIIRINDTELQWLGYERDEVIGKMKITDFFTDTGKLQFSITYPLFLKTGYVENLEFDLVSKNGDMRSVSVNKSAIRDDENHFVMTRSVLFDITNIKKVQQQLKQLADDQQAMLDNELVGILKTHDRRIGYINLAMAHIVGYEQGELDGQSTRMLFPDDAAYEAFGDAVYPILNSGSTYRAQIELVRKDKEKIWMDISGSKLPGSYNESLWMMLDITPLKKHQLEVEKMAYHDILTGLPNRLLVADRIKQALAQAERANQLLAVCYLDLDGFKPVNDQYGHAAGDKLLIELARRMEKLVRGNDTVGRIGGDEFVLLLTNLDTADDYRSVLNRVIEEINTPFLIDSSTEVSVGASIGVTLFPNDGDDADILLRHSDQAMYQAKRLGRNRICEYGICINN